MASATFKREMETYFQALSDSMFYQMERTDRVMNLSREITRSSKDAISTLLRAYQESDPNVLKAGENKIDFIRLQKFPLFFDMVPHDTLEHFRHRHHLTQCLQEFIEAMGLLQFIKSNSFLTYENVVNALTYKTEVGTTGTGAGAERVIEVTYTDYMLGMCDVFGELTRICTSVTESLEKDFLFKTLHMAQQFYKELIKFDGLPRDEFKNKINTLKSSVSKMEDAISEMKLREAETLRDSKLLNKALEKYFPPTLPVSVVPPVMDENQD